MITKRIIPCLDVDRGRVVKGISFVDIRDAGDPVELASFYDAEGADEVVFLDITASHEKRKTVVELASKTAEKVFIPYTIGGGIKNIDDIREVLKKGADKISINTQAFTDPSLIVKGARIFGNQCIVVAIDAKYRRKDFWKSICMVEGHPQEKMQYGGQKKQKGLVRERYFLQVWIKTAQKTVMILSLRVQSPKPSIFLL